MLFYIKFKVFAVASNWSAITAVASNQILKSSESRQEFDTFRYVVIVIYLAEGKRLGIKVLKRFKKYSIAEMKRQLSL